MWLGGGLWAAFLMSNTDPAHMILRGQRPRIKSKAYKAHNIRLLRDFLLGKILKRVELSSPY